MIRINNNYDFSGFLEVFDKMLETMKCTTSQTTALAKELNRFFRDSKCNGVVFTDNNDKMFFGMKVIPIINADKIYDYLISDEPVRISEYMIEIDSHLLDPVLHLSSREMLAFLLHEVGHVINDSAPIDNARNVLNEYLTTNGESLRMSQSIHYKEILAYGLKDYISKRNSILYTANDEELFADDFVYKCGFGDDLENGLNKICKNSMKMYSNTNVDKTIVFFWTLRLYRHVGVRRINALHTLARAKQFTGSRLEKLEIENVIRRINRVDDNDLITESFSATIKNKMRKLRNNSIRNIADDFYELSMRSRNVEDEDDALYLMRRINNHIAILEDYIYDTDATDREKSYWRNTLDKFIGLRENLAKKCTYRSNKDFAIYVNYPDIK